MFIHKRLFFDAFEIHTPVLPKLKRGQLKAARFIHPFLETGFIISV
ncbi:MAG: hypothetical protein FWF87_06470 [Synergistaceae bacterium]|nr:hypothetical protein [Synergistaceae bacterium]